MRARFLAILVTLVLGAACSSTPPAASPTPPPDAAPAANRLPPDREHGCAGGCAEGELCCSSGACCSRSCMPAENGQCPPLP